MPTEKQAAGKGQYEILSVIIQWQTPHSKEVAERADLVGRNLHRTDRSHLHFSVGPVLSDDGLAELELVGVEGVLHWRLFATRRPDGKVPRRVQTSDKRAGGHAGLRDLVLSALSGTPTQAVVNLLVGVDSRQLFAPALRDLPLPDKAKISLGRGYVPQEVGFRFAEGADGIEAVSITCSSDASTFHTTISARIPAWIPTANQWVPVDQLIQRVLEAFFETSSP